MADENRTIERNTVVESRSSGGITFIVGGLVVAVGVIAWLVFGSGIGVASKPADSTSNTSVTIEAPAAAPAPAPAEPAPAAPAEAAPKVAP